MPGTGRNALVLVFQNPGVRQAAVAGPYPELEPVKNSCPFSVRNVAG